MDYKERWCEIYEELKEQFGREPEGIEIDQALADDFSDLADCYR